MHHRTLRGVPIILTLLAGLTFFAGPSFAQDQAWEGLITAGRSALKLEKFSEAERHFETALETAEKFPPGDPRLGRSLNNLAAVYYAQQDYARAEPLMRRSLNVLEETLGPTNADVAQTKKNLAALYYLQGNFAEAEPLLQQSLAILEELHGPNHAYVATVLNNLAGLYQAQDRYQDAEPLLARSLEIWEALLGNDHPDVVKSRELLERLREAKGPEPDGAENVDLAESGAGEPIEVGQASENQAADEQHEAVNEQLIALGAEAEAAAANVSDIGTAAPPDVLADRDSNNDRDQENVDGDTGEAAKALAALSRSEAAAAAAKTEGKGSAIGANSSPLPTPQVQAAALETSPEPDSAGPSSDEPVFAVYLSTLWSKDEAQLYWQALKQEVPDLLANKEMELEEVAFDSGQGSFYRVLTMPYTSDPEAQEACDLIKSQVRTHDCNVIAR